MTAPTGIPAGLPARYRVESELGVGAMGRVVAAFDATIRRRVAIKIMNAPPANDRIGQESFQRFRREAQAAGGLKHPGVVAIYDFGEDAEAAWMVMELVEGGTLRDLLDRQYQFGLPETQRIITEVLDALAFCHEQGVVHRDIKPANIMLTRADPPGRVKIADFGIAHLKPDQQDGDADLTTVGESQLGTPSYMSPEQFRGDAADRRSDIWATGVVLYQMLTGKKPFPGGYAAVQYKVLHEDPVPPSREAPSTPPGLDAVIARALAKDAAARFPDAREFAAALAAAVAAPVAAAPATEVFRSSEPQVVGSVGDGARRIITAPKPGTPAPAAPKGGGGKGALLAGVAAVLLLAGGGGAWWFLGRTPASAPEQPPAPPIRIEPTRPEPARPEPPRPDPPRPEPPRPEPVRPEPPRPEPVRPEPGRPDTPGTDAQQSPAGRPDPREAAIDAAMRGMEIHLSCGWMQGSRTGTRVRLTGVSLPQELSTVHNSLAVAGATLDSAVEVIEPQYCPLVRSLRPVLVAPGGRPDVEPRARRVQDGDRLTLSITGPEAGGVVNLWFVMHDGKALRLLTDMRMAPGQRAAMSETAPNFPWVIGPPYGLEMVMMVVTEQPLFTEQRPFEESIDQLSAALGPALQAARARNGRVSARVTTVETLAR
ncbi:serine/threonine protein kinase [Rhodovarius crocodyli]|uniref:non-specific serine/threonine protein kinase n=1 Tax=Rhodovarius crocodyli TaxID=1979269 RepID=A0A437MMD2_9PROT|nr:serine/threonine-protein kinase [Rhodovarius crocodyli]RVT98789.1 serine/threonine protein kinase [Rhodovarius crocodyli]